MPSSFYLIVVLLLAGNIVRSQTTKLSTDPVNSDNYKYYIHKSSVQKTYAWVAVSTGIVLYGIGLTQQAGNYYIDNDPSKGYPPSKRTPYYIAGTIAELISIPFFISAKHDKKKASVSLKNEAAILYNILHPITYPSISFKYKFQ